MKGWIVGVVAVIVIIVIVAVAYLFFRIPNESCAVASTKIGEQLNNSNYCTLDSDCKIVNKAYCGADGFSCYKLLNKNADLSDIDKQYETFTKNCQPICPELACIIPPNQSQVACRQGKCVDTRI